MGHRHTKSSIVRYHGYWIPFFWKTNQGTQKPGKGLDQRHDNNEDDGLSRFCLAQAKVDVWNVFMCQVESSRYEMIVDWIFDKIRKIRRVYVGKTAEASRKKTRIVIGSKYYNN